MSKYSYDVCIVGGLGHVGLPFGITLAHTGQRVALYDINQKAIETVSSGKMPFLEQGAEEILQEVLGERLFVFDRRDVITESRYVVIIIGTPVDEHLNPEFKTFYRVINEVIDLVQDDQHIVLRSTIYPGTTETVRRYLEDRGKQTRLSFCPERIAQGKAVEELRTLPQIISAFDDVSLQEARELFEGLSSDIIVLSPKEAELAKLFTNVWRYIQFSIANQFYQIATKENVDFYRIYNAITYNYPRAQHFPTPGFAAGPCLFKDTMQLAAHNNHSFFLGHAAMLVNEGLPNFVVDRLKEKYPLKEKVVGILGMAFKADNDDRRESLSYKLKKLLEIEAREVLCTDVYIREDGFVAVPELVKKADIVIVATPHREYRDIRFRDGQTVVDVWNLYPQRGLS